MSQAPAEFVLTLLCRDVGSMVLARAVKWHTEHRVLRDGHRAVASR